MEAEQRLFARFGKEVPKGTILFRENDPGQEMYIIQSGKVKISKKVRDIEKTLVVLEKGDFFGEMSILNNKPRSATAEVIEDARLLVIDPMTFETMIRSNTEIAVRIIKNLAARLQEADKQIENLLLRDNASRLVNTLTRFASEKGEKTPQGIRIGLSVAELGSAAGISGTQVEEILKKLIDARILKREEGGELLVPDVDLLGKYFQYLEMKEQFERA
ncbi:MAG: Crp/Fnr family transcriptional regulator [candidate division NC10 bacterium]|nr:Crp/Fnr family transcriptional regulator [candidate division NC10 bacterium]